MKDLKYSLKVRGTGEKGVIYVYYTSPIDKKQHSICTGLKAKKKHMSTGDKKSPFCTKGVSREDFETNSSLNAWFAKFEKFWKVLSEDLYYNSGEEYYEYFKNKILGEVNGKESNSLQGIEYEKSMAEYDYLQGGDGFLPVSVGLEYIENRKNITDSTKVSYSNALNTLIKWFEGKGIKSLRDYTAPNLKAHFDYLILERGLAPSTLNVTRIALLNVLPKIFLEDNLISQQQYDAIHNLRIEIPKKQASERSYLNMEELHELEGFNDLSESDLRIKDLYLFQCYTGQRICDIIGLSINKPGCYLDEEEQILQITQKKTSTEVCIPLNAKALEILEKYQGTLPTISTNQVNKRLKAIFKKAGFNRGVKVVTQSGLTKKVETRPLYECVGTHSARRTYITQALSLGIPTELIASVSGHKSIEVLLNYDQRAKMDKAKAVASKMRF